MKSAPNSLKYYALHGSSWCREFTIYHKSSSYESIWQMRSVWNFSTRFYYEVSTASERIYAWYFKSTNFCFQIGVSISRPIRNLSFEFHDYIIGYKFGKNETRVPENIYGCQNRQILYLLKFVVRIRGLEPPRGCPH